MKNYFIFFHSHFQIYGREQHIMLQNRCLVNRKQLFSYYFYKTIQRNK